MAGSVRRCRSLLVVTTLVAGLLFTASPAGADTVYTVVAGDTLSGIAADHGVSLGDLIDANDLSDADTIYIGQQLVIPVDEDAEPPPSTDYGEVVVEGRGWGHGRGMGQYGALGYAINHGWTRDEILGHFYGNTEAETLDPQDIGVRLLSHDDEATTVVVADAILVVGDEAGNWIELDDQAVQVTLDGNVDRYSIAVGPDCGGPFTDAGFDIESPIVRIRSAHYVVPSPSTTTTSTTTSTSTTTTTTTTVAPDPVLEVIDTGDADLDVTLGLCDSSTSGTWYRGELRAARYEGNQRTVNYVDVEQYLRSVVPREMPASWADKGDGSGAHALESQAVAARSYSLAEDRYGYAKTCDTTRCQVYYGRSSWSGSSTWSNEDDRSDAAIEATAGLVRVFGDDVARTEFSASTGGHTITGVFPGVPDDGDNVLVDGEPYNPVHRWTEELSFADLLAAFVEPSCPLDDLYEAVVVNRDGHGDDGGRGDLELRSRNGCVTVVAGYDFQRQFGLKSKWFNVEYGPPDAGDEFPDEIFDEYRVSAGYTDDEVVALESAAEFFDADSDEFQRTAVGLLAFLLALLEEGAVSPMENPPAVDGAHEVESSYRADDGTQGALETVAEAFGLTGTEAQKFSASVLIFLVSLAQAGD